MKTLVCTMLAVLGLCLTASAQSRFSNAAFSGGYTHISGYQGMNGFDVGGEVVVVRPVALAFDYDGVWNTSTLGVFETTPTGLTSVKTHMQDVLIGPRAYFALPVNQDYKFLHKLMPFFEAQFGVSNINSTVSVVNSGSISASANDFTWELGGGGDIRLNPRWAVRTKIDLLRTHFVNEGQSHARFVLGLVYSVKPREKW